MDAAIYSIKQKQHWLLIADDLTSGAGQVPLGDVFTVNLDHPCLLDIFQEAIGGGFTDVGLEKDVCVFLLSAKSKV